MKHTRMAVLTLVALVASCEEKPAPAPVTPAPPPAAAPTPAPSAAPSAAPSEPPVPVIPAPAPGAAGTVSALGLSFTIPEGWKSVPPANSMRLAELQLPDPSGDAAKACTAVFSTAGGEVQANIDRWAGQVRDAAGQPSKPTVEKRTVGGLPVHIAEMTGAFSPGMGDSNVYQNWMMRAAIVETPAGLLFIKMTGPAEQMTKAGAAFNAMVDGMKKP